MGYNSTVPALAILWENRYCGRPLLFRTNFRAPCLPPLFTLSHLTFTVHPTQEYVLSHSEFKT